MNPIRLTFTLTTAAFLALAPAALADTTATIKNGELFVRDSISVTDPPMDVLIEPSGTQIRITDAAGDMRTDSTCAHSGAAVLCPANVSGVRIEAGTNNDVIENLTALDATWDGNKGIDILRGGPGDDVMDGGPGNDKLFGNGGRDVAGLEDGQDKIDLGADADTVSYDGANVPVDVTLLDNGGFNDGPASEGDRLIGVENLIGTANDDTLTGSDLRNIITGRGGADVISAGDGDDRINPQFGADVVHGDGGIDTVLYRDRTAGVTVTLDGAVGDGEPLENDNIDDDVENLEGGAGPDKLTGSSKDNLLLGNGGNDVLNGSTGADVLDGGVGIDATSYERRVAGVTVTLENNGAADDGNALDGSGDTTLNIENAIGSFGPDELFGAAGPNVINASNGDDKVFVLDGEEDRVDCGLGNDGIQFDLSLDDLNNCEFVIP